MGAFTLIGEKLNKIKWLAEAPAREFFDACATMTDLLVGGVQEAFFGAYGPFPPYDAVPLIAKDRALVPGLVEPAGAFAVRAPKWLDVRRTAGNVRTMLDAVAAVWAPLDPVVKCVRNFGWASGPMQSRWTVRDSDGTISDIIANPANFDWDGQQLAHRAFIIIHAPASPTIFREGKFGDGASVYGDRDVRPFDGVQDKLTTGTTAFSEYCTRTREAIATTIPASLWVPWIIVAFDPASFDPLAAPGAPGMPDGSWGLPAVYDAGLGVYEETRLKSARYWVGFR